MTEHDEGCFTQEEDCLCGLDEPLRIMTKEQILERQELNRANTAPALRARVLKELAKQNGEG